MTPIRVLNMTRLFDREMLIYSFFDIKLKRPASVSFIIYFLSLLLIVGGPMFYLFGMNPYSFMIGAGVPFGLATMMNKPIWGGKHFFDFMKCQVNFILQPKRYFDLRAIREVKLYRIDHTIQISRRKDYQELAMLERKYQNESK